MPASRTACTRRAVSIACVLILGSAALSACYVDGRAGSRDWWRVGVSLPLPSGDSSNALYCERDEEIARVEDELRCVPKQPDGKHEPAAEDPATSESGSSERR